MTDAAIIGAGPAGISAALYCVRGGLTVVLFDGGGSSLIKAASIENYYGIASISGSELLAAGIEQAETLGVKVVPAEVTGVDFLEHFTVATTNGTYEARTVLLATGQSVKRPPLPGLDRYEGAGVSYCAVCDGFFYRGKHVGVFGAGKYALAEASELLHFAGSVTIFTNGRTADFETDIPVDPRKITGLYGEDTLSGLRGEDDSPIPLDGLFIAEGRAGSSDFARKLGVETRSGSIVADERQQTNVPGLFAAGDCTGGIRQISVAVGEGAKAGLAMVETIRRS